MAWTRWIGIQLRGRYEICRERSACELHRMGSWLKFHWMRQVPSSCEPEPGIQIWLNGKFFSPITGHPHTSSRILRSTMLLFTDFHYAIVLLSLEKYIWMGRLPNDHRWMIITHHPPPPPTVRPKTIHPALLAIRNRRSASSDRSCMRVEPKRFVNLSVVECTRRCWDSQANQRLLLTGKRLGWCPPPLR